MDMSTFLGIPTSMAMDHDLELPAYSLEASSESESRSPALDQNASIPETRPREHSEHSYVLTDGKDRPWATLLIQSSSRSPQQMPTFLENEPIEGSLLLDLDKKESITSVLITMKGKIIAGFENGQRLAVSDSYVFLNDTHVLWRKTNNDPRIPTPFPLSTEILQGGTLTGRHHWPFSLSLPSEVTLSPISSEPVQSYRLPQTLLERFTAVSIQYELIVEFTRSLLRSNSRIRQVFAYIPCTRPPPTPHLRRLAYQENTPLVPPEADPEGWKTLKLVVLKGTIFTPRQIDIQCTLSLAIPLSYSRGTVIPLFLTLSSEDTQALDLLSSNNSISIWLCRRIRYHMFPSHARKSNQTDTAWKESSEVLECAVWWPATSIAGDDITTKRLNGEIRLSKDLMPTTSIAHLTVKYAIVVLPFTAAAFIPSQPKDEPVVSEVVGVTTTLGPGPEPKAYAPPGYNYGKKRLRAPRLTQHGGL